MNCPRKVSKEDACYVAVYSTDKEFMANLIKYLESQDTKEGTVARLHDMDPYEEVDLLQAQIEGMKIRMYDAETKLNTYKGKT